jgi:hypothetical protein
VVSLFRADIAAGCSLIRGTPNLVKSALRLVRTLTFDTPPNWEVLLMILGLVRAAVATPPSSHESAAKWDSKLVASENAVRAARILSRRGVKVPPIVIAHSEGRALTALLREAITAAAAAAKLCADAGEGTEVEVFGRLWADVRDLHAYGFGRALTLAKALEEFVRAALLAQAWAAAERCAPLHEKFKIKK